MHHSPTVSVIIPHFNRSNVITNTLKSVISQTYTAWEIIIVDDKSEESEFLKVKSVVNDERIRIIRNETSIKGPSVCRNLGAEIALGKYLLFLDSDDLLAPFCLEQRVSAMELNPSVVLGVFLSYVFYKVSGDSSKVYNITDIPSKHFINSFIQNKNPWQTMAPLWQRKFFQSIGEFDVELFYMEDPEVHIRALLADAAHVKTFYHLPADCYYRMNYHDDTKLDFYDNSIKYRILFYNKICLRLSEKGLLNAYKADIRIGLVNFFKNFLITRILNFQTYYLDFINLISEFKLFPFYKVALLSVTVSIWKSDKKIIKYFKLRGISYHLFCA